MVRPNRIAGGLEMKSCFVLSIIFFSFVIQKILCIYPYVGGPIFVSIRDQIFIFLLPKKYLYVYRSSFYGRIYYYAR